MENKLDYTELDLGDNVVLVAGAGGTIGSGIIGRIRASKIIACDLSEYAIYRLRRQYGDKFEYVVGDLSDGLFVEHLYSRHAWTYVVNCAAYKHVDLMESDDNIYSAIKNNIGVLISLLRIDGRGYRCTGFIQISSDKAVNPVNNMGKTKAYCEHALMYYAAVLDSLFKSTDVRHEFKIVRFGNVYGSSGSFVETLDWQIARGLPITVTDVGMMRYFLTIDDACSLICRAAMMPENGTYVLDMGREVSIMDIVAEKNVDNLPVEIIGLRTGEKLREELTGAGEELISTGDPLINRIAWDSSNTKINKNFNAMLLDADVIGRMDIHAAIKLLGMFNE